MTSARGESFLEGGKGPRACVSISHSLVFLTLVLDRVCVCVDLGASGKMPPNAKVLRWGREPKGVVRLLAIERRALDCICWLALDAGGMAALFFSFRWTISYDWDEAP